VKITKTTTKEIRPEYRINTQSLRVVVIVDGERKICALSKHLYTALENDVEIRNVIDSVAGVADVTPEDYDKRKQKPTLKGGENAS
jgi:hypothetical protein